MSFVYGELVQANEDIKIAEHSIPKNYEPIIEVIDAWIKDRLASPLHLTAYVLNPFYHYKNPLLHLEHDVAISMIECVDILFPGDVDLQDKIMNEEFPKYKDKESLFGKPVAVKGCSLNDAGFDPASWWSNFGAITPNLQRLSMRILSLTSSSSSCERNWSTFEGIHTKKRNRLGIKLLNNLVFVQFNARLLSKQKREKDRSNVDTLLSNDSTTTQECIVNDDVVDDDVAGMGRLGPRTPKYRTVRELYDKDFESEDEEITENGDGDELDGDHFLEDV
ncbi:hypothetical protein C2S53_017181 [Perilla frutescens var. hirtella]|uniref:HAT C-terminal dimerisation domain-containing protein n=1 Tax=Perilla frutescens var. hirtella TaxID=608512 RepID=A0AAD4JKN7_PERFH|nr:hypothetical protein C2S53_017181 [Perilla frutescens var. hirtella]